MLLPLWDGLVATRDGDDEVRPLADRHYSRKTVGARLWVGPGRRLVLRDTRGDVLFTWRHSLWRLDGQKGYECTLFRNEGPRLSSEVIREAAEAVWVEWGAARLFTYVDPSRVASANPGYCFLQAGWRRVGYSQTGLHLLECLP